MIYHYDRDRIGYVDIMARMRKSKKLKELSSAKKEFDDWITLHKVKCTEPAYIAGNKVYIACYEKLVQMAYNPQNWAINTPTPTTKKPTLWERLCKLIK